SVRSINEAIPQSVENIILKATTKDPFHRYQSVAEMEQMISVSLHPNNRDERAYVPPIQVGEETKAIPIITDEMTNKVNLEEVDDPTLIHRTESSPTETIDKEVI